MQMYILKKLLPCTAVFFLSACISPGVSDVDSGVVRIEYAADVWHNDSRGATYSADVSRKSAEVALRRHVQEKASKALSAGQELDITFTRIDRAGDYEWGRGSAAQDVRIVRDIYPPRIDLTFRLSNAEGATIKAGNSQLRDPAFMMHTNMYPNDALRFEKALLDDWVRRELPVKK